MSQETREKALHSAILAGAPINAPHTLIVEIARVFEAFLTGEPTSPPAKTEVKAAVKAVVTPKAEPKPAKAEKKAEPDYKKIVGDKVNALLAANKRNEAITLLASFNGAKSATGIIEQGAEVIAAFVEGADALLNMESLAD